MEKWRFSGYKQLMSVKQILMVSLPLRMFYEHHNPDYLKENYVTNT